METFCCIIGLPQPAKQKGVLHMLDLLYNEKTVIGRLQKYFSQYFSCCPAPTARNLFLFVLSIIALESAPSIRFLYRHFICKLTEKSLNTFYYMCSYAKVDYTAFMKVTASVSLNIIPEKLESLPVFLCIDDTMVEKFGKKFSHASKLYDHAAHNGSNYLNGHCFVSLMLCVPVWESNEVAYKGIPLGYRMWQKEVSKLSLAAEMVRTVMEVLAKKNQIVVLADSWYGKSEIFALKNQFDNLDVTCNVRRDTVLYDLAPPRTGKKGRPPKHGKRLSVVDDFILSDEKVGDYYVAHRQVVTNLLRDHVLNAYVTAPEKESGRWLFLSTVDIQGIEMSCAKMENTQLNQCDGSWKEYIPLFFYSFRWQIEVSYYEQKTFWSLCRYMVRSTPGIEMMINLICTTYSAVRLLPYVDPLFSKYRGSSPQEIRFALSQKIHEQIFLSNFAFSAESGNNSTVIINAVKLWIFAKSAVAEKL